MTDMTVVVGKIMRVFGTLVWKITECSELNKMFCERLEDKNIESKGDMEASLVTFQRDSETQLGAIHGIYFELRMCFWSAGGEKSAVINRKTKLLP